MTDKKGLCFPMEPPCQLLYNRRTFDCKPLRTVSMQEPLSPFSLANLYPSFGKGPMRFLAPMIEALMGLNKLNKGYQEAAHETDQSGFLQEVVNYFQLKSHVDYSELSHLPLEGAGIIVANHPTGLAETILLYLFLTQRRGDIKFLANNMLKNVPQIKDMIIETNPFDSKAAKRTNMLAVRSALNWLNEGKLLVVFPAGEVSHFTLKERQVKDGPWSDLPLYLARKTKAFILPVYCHGGNSWLFQLAGYIHPYLRTLLLPRAFVKQGNKGLPITLGHPLDIKMDKTGVQDAKWLQQLTYALRYKNELDLGFRKENRRLVPIVAETASYSIKHIVDALPPEAKVLSQGEFDSFAVKGNQLGSVLTEIGRQREIAFRAVGEGTGKAIDLDQFDPHFYQLFIWDRKNEKLVSGCRIGRVDELMEQQGVQGLYVSEFYEHVNNLIAPDNGKTVEIGRSFVSTEYQGQVTPMLLMWKTMGHFTARLKEYRYMIGLVTLSRTEMSEFGLQFLVSCLKKGQYASKSKVLVVPKYPYDKKPLPKPFRALAKLPLSFRQISQIIESLDHRPAKPNILLKHYCQQMGAECINFTVDRDFADVVDILIRVDLARSDAAHVKRYFGEEGYQNIKTRWR